MQASIEAGNKYGLDPGWLNSSATIFIPTSCDPEAVTVFDEPGLTVLVSSLTILLAMKARSARSKDMNDLATLIPLSNITTPAELIRLVRETYQHVVSSYPTDSQRAVFNQAFQKAGLL